MTTSLLPPTSDRLRSKWGSKADPLAGRIVTAFPIALSVAVVFAVLLLSGRGLDLMDESYVLRLLAIPQASRAAGEVYLFPFVLHPLYQATGEDIALFRVVGTLLVAAFAIAASREAVKLSAGHAASRELLLVTALPAAAASTVVFTLGVRVLGYRSLVLLGLLLVAWGFARHWRGYTVSGGLVAGSGVWLTFAGKPTSAVALVVVLGAFMLRDGLSRPLLLSMAAGGTVSAGVTLGVAGLSPLGAYQYLQGGAAIARSLGGHPSLLQMLGVGPIYVAPFVVLGIPMVLFVWVTSRLRSSAGHRAHAWLDLISEVVLVTMGVVMVIVLAAPLSERTQGMQALSLSLVAPVLLIWQLFGSRRDGGAETRVRRYALLLLVLPWTFAVGSNVSIAFTASQAVVLWVIALAVIATEGSLRARQPNWLSHSAVLMTACVTIAAVIQCISYADGPRGAQLSVASRSATVAGGTLQIKSVDAAIAEGLHRVALENGITAQTPVVDVTGMGAGYAFMLGGRPLGRAHLYGAWPGKVASAKVALSAERCSDLAKAWIIFAPSNPSDVSEAMESFGIQRWNNYETVHTFDALRYDHQWHFELMRPLVDNAPLDNCRAG